MHLGADMMRDQSHDALAIGRDQHVVGGDKTFAQPVDPEPAIGIQHHFDDGGVFEVAGDRGAERCAQHARTTRQSFVAVMMTRHRAPLWPSARRLDGDGDNQERQNLRSGNRIYLKVRSAP